MVIWCYDSNGNLCTNFGTGGIVVYDGGIGPYGIDMGYSITVDPSGRILVTGSSRNASGYIDMVIWCYDSNGNLCTNFGTGGMAHNNVGGGYSFDEGHSLTVDPSLGRILVTGNSWNDVGGYEMVTWCYDSNGNLCTNFGTGGIVVSDGAAGGYDDEGHSLTVDPSSGRILVTGYGKNALGNNDVVIWCYDSNGNLCINFGTGGNGFVVSGIATGGDGHDYGNSIALDSSHRILITGSSQFASNVSPDMVIWRYLSIGILDTDPTNGFGPVDQGTGLRKGFVAYNSTEGMNLYSDDGGMSITLDSSDRILVTGYGENLTQGLTDMAIWRYLPDGTLDTDFGTGGIVTHNSAAGGGDFDVGNSITLDSLGRILVTGYSTAIGDQDMVIWRYLP